MQSILAKTGLTKNEAKVYLSLLNLGSACASEITKHSKVHRVNVYDVLERLVQKGLVSILSQEKRRTYKAGDPNQLLYLIDEKKNTLEKIMPMLQNEFRLKKSKQDVYQFLGADGVMQSYYMMLEQDDIIYALGGSGLNRKYLKHRHEIFNKERKKRNVKGKMIYYESVRDSKKKAWKDPTMQIRYIPDDFSTIGMVDICGNLIINLHPVKDNIMAIVIENQILADTYKRFFEFIWTHAKE